MLGVQGIEGWLLVVEVWIVCDTLGIRRGRLVLSLNGVIPLPLSHAPPHNNVNSGQLNLIPHITPTRAREKKSNVRPHHSADMGGHR